MNSRLDFNPITTIILFIPPRYRGVSDQRLQTRGGERWPGCRQCRRCGANVPPAVQAALFPACLPHAEAPLTADGRRVVRRSPAKWPGPHTVDFVAVTLNRHTRTERTDHRGERGANLINTARGTPLDLADLRFAAPKLAKSEGGHRTSTSLDVARRRGPWVHQDLRRPARPRISSRQRTNCRCGSVPASGQTTADPAPAKNTGGGALAKAV